MQQPLPFIHHKKTEVRVAPLLKRKRIIHDDDCDDPVVVSSASSAPRVIHDDVCDDPVVDSSASSAPNVSATGPADAQLLLQQQMDDGCSAIDVSSDSGDDLLVAPAACEQPSPASDAQLPSQQQLIPFTAKIPFSAKTLKDYFGPNPLIMWSCSCCGDCC